ncbi:hypothetical protein ZWY2020_007623 [Hordeum vulgare]|nr:hypothetical protein ZWY2020_007623 [Hordeum vulgare]
MFARNAATMSCNLEITVIQRTRGQRCVKPSSPRPSASRTRASSRTPSAPRTPSANSTASVNESQEHQKKPLDPIVEEALPDAHGVEDEVLYPGYVQHNNDEEDAANKEYIPAEFSDADEDEKQEDVEMGVFEDAEEDKPVKMYDRESPCIAEANEPVEAEIQEEEKDETTRDVQQQMPPPKEPSHDASTEASCAVRTAKRASREGAAEATAGACAPPLRPSRARSDEAMARNSPNAEGAKETATSTRPSYSVASSATSAQRKGAGLGSQVGAMQRWRWPQD